MIERIDESPLHALTLEYGLPHRSILVAVHSDTPKAKAWVARTRLRTIRCYTSSSLTIFYRPPPTHFIALMAIGHYTLATIPPIPSPNRRCCFRFSLTIWIDKILVDFNAVKTKSWIITNVSAAFHAIFLRKLMIERSFLLLLFPFKIIILKAQPSWNHCCCHTQRWQIR